MADTGSPSLTLQASLVATVGTHLAFERDRVQIKALDGLRALAIILVLLRHGYTAFSANHSPSAEIFGWDLTTVMANGWIGVDLFFVLSGLLITQHIARVFERDDEPWHWRPYLAKRMLRIVPSYYAVLLLVFVNYVLHIVV